MFNVEVDLGGDLGSLGGFDPLDGDQSGERHEQQRVSEMTEHNFCRSNLTKSCRPEIWEVEGRDLCRGWLRDFYGDMFSRPLIPTTPNLGPSNEARRPCKALPFVDL